MRDFIIQEMGPLMDGAEIIKGLVAININIISLVAILEYEFKAPHPNPEIVRYIAWATSGEYRRRGLARKMAQELLADESHITTEIESSNEPSVNLALSLGFLLIEERPGNGVGDFYAWEKDTKALKGLDEKDEV